MKNTLLRAGLAIALAATTALGMAACGSSDNGGATGATTQSDNAGAATADAGDGTESEAFIQDMKDGVKIVNDQIAKEANMTKIMIASDVEQPTQKYGMWVMPYYPSDAVQKFIQSIEIANGKEFVVTAVSADTGKTWMMDQDENMTEVTE